MNEYNIVMTELRSVSPEAAAELESTKYQWVRDMFTPNFKNHYITYNLSERMNASMLVARYLPCVDLIDNIRIKIKNI